MNIDDLTITDYSPSGDVHINPLSAGTPSGTYYLGDTMGEWFYNFEIGQSSWDNAQVGIGTALDGTGYNWGTASWYQDGDGNNKRVRRNLSGYQYTAVGNHYVICQARSSSSNPYTSKSGAGWGNYITYPPSDLTSAYFTCLALNDPGNQSATAAGTTSISLGWAKNGQGHDVMIVRSTDSNFTAPTGGTTYTPGSSTIGGDLVVYRGGATNFTDTGLSAGTTYYYKFYSENWTYYSAGVTASATTHTPTPTIVLADNGTQVAAGNVAAGTTAHVLSSFKVTVSVTTAKLTKVAFTTAGTYQTADISNLKLLYSTSATLGAGAVTLKTINNPAAAGAKSFDSLSQEINAGSVGYFFITADIASAATGGRTIGVSAIGNADLTFASGNKSGSASAGGAQTIITLPTLTSPTATGIGQAAATLGANVTGAGGGSVSARGTVYGTSANPTGNELQQGTGTGVFTHERTGLSQGTKYYYRGYAVNWAGTGYSPQGSFYTEPGQASAVSISGISATGMTISWTAGAASDGAIVVVRAGNAVADGPTDGTLHSASATYGSQALGNCYVVYRGSGTSVDVTGLTAGTTYHVAVYAYKGTVADSGDDQGINYRQTSPATGSAPTCPPAPVIAAATGVGSTNFTANWQAASGATGYRLDVMTDVGGGAGGNSIEENIQDWTNQSSYGAYQQSIAAGTVNMTDCIVQNSAAASGDGSAGRVQ
ncbi:MAG: hypothetical protein QM346_06145, partial [Chloroflexota bacterium]|nr:hypothetical protein [Chloroflexota bacterium]